MNFLDRFPQKLSDVKFNGNLFSGSRVVSCGQTDGQTDRQTMTIYVNVNRHSTFPISLITC